jgi:hypothetical protein
MAERSMTRRVLLKGAAGLAVAAPVIMAGRTRAAEDDAKPQALFNGKDLTGWEGNPDFWSVEDGAITGATTAEKPTKGNTFIIWRGGTLKDFELAVQFRLANHNSGVQYRSKDCGNFVVRGYQADMDGANTYTGMLYEEGGRGIVCKPGQKVTLAAGEKPKVDGQAAEPDAIKAAIKTGDWNTLLVTARGNRLIHKINDVVTADVTDDDEKARAMEGILAFQLHAGPPMKVQFKDVMLKAL